MNNEPPTLETKLLTTEAGKALVEVANIFNRPLDIDGTNAYAYFTSENSRMVLHKLMTIGRLFNRSGGILNTGEDLSKLVPPRPCTFANFRGTTTVKFPDGLIKVIYTNTTIAVNITE